MRTHVRNVAVGLGVVLLSACQAWGDTAAGMRAFRAKDYGQAFQEWKAAADAGQAEAEFDLGLLYAQYAAAPSAKTWVS